MALLFMDGFDHYGGSTSIAVAGAWRSLSGSVQTGVKRTSTHAFNPGSGSGGSNIRNFNVSGGASKCIVGAAYNMNGISGFNSVSFLQIWDTTDAILFEIVVKSDGFFEFWKRQPTSALLGTATRSVNTGVWQYWEFEWDRVAGTIKVYLDNVVQLNLTGQTLGSNNAGVLHIGGFLTGPGFYVDDVYVADGTGSKWNSPAGDIRIYPIFPNAPGAVSDFLPVGATPNFAAVDEANPDGDSTYVESSTVGAKDSYEMENLASSLSGVIRGIQLQTYARKTDAGAASMRMNVRSGTSPNTVAAGDDKTLTTGYQWYWTPFYDDPVSGVPFTLSEIDNLQMQIEVRS